MPATSRRAFLGFAAGLAAAAAGAKLLGGAKPAAETASPITGAVLSLDSSSTIVSETTAATTVFYGQRFGFEEHPGGRRRYVEFDVGNSKNSWRVEGPFACQCWSHAGKPV